MAKKKNTKIKPFEYTFSKFLDSLPEKINCVICRKEFETHAKCFKPITTGKGKNKLTSGAIAPFLIVGRITTMLKHPVACKVCSYKIIRVAGVIPERYDSDTFPQVVTGGLEVDEMMERLRSKKPKKHKWFIMYKKKKDVPHTKALYDKYLTEACKKYLKKFSETPYNLKQLKQYFKTVGLKSHPLEFE
jgi:hypothetical protein